MKVLLTSCGLETEGIQKKFYNFLDKNATGCKALFIPTAAISADAIDVLPKCMNDLIKSGFSREHITVYDLHKPMTFTELMKYDVVYLCGGDANYLMSRINEIHFNVSLMEYIHQNGIVIGVSAGSMIFGSGIEHNLGLLNRPLDVHCPDNVCETTGTLNTDVSTRIKLGNQQAIVFDKEAVYIIE